MAEDLVTVSVKMSRALFARVQAYAREHRFSVSELLREGVEWRLGESADPLAYRYGATGNTSTGEMEPPAAQERAAVERHQAIMGLLSEIRAHQRAPQPMEPLAAPVGTVIPVIPTAPVTPEAPVGMVIPVVPHAPVASVESRDPVIPVIPEAHTYDPAKFVLHALCRHGHAYQGTGMSLFYRNTKHGCVDCKRANSTRAKAKARGAIMHAGAMLLLLLLASSAGAARELPTLIDLRAAYCVPVMQDKIVLVQPLTTTPEFAPEGAALLAEAQNNLQRLQRYLLPRLPHLNAPILEATMQRAKADIAKSGQLAKACQARCQQMAHPTASAELACLDTCVNREDPQHRYYKECDDLRWLPY